MRLKTLFFSLLFTPLIAPIAHAQNFYTDTLPHPVESHVALKIMPARLTPPAVVATEVNLAAALQSSLQSLSSVSPKSCSSEDSYLYLLSQTIKGNYETCAAFAESCARAGSNTPVPTLIQGARCAKALHAHNRAFAIFEAGRQSDDFSGERASALILEFAIFAQYSVFSTHTDSILASHPTWTAEERTDARALVDFLGKNPSSTRTKEQIFAFIDRQISTSSDFFHRLLKSHRVALYVSEYQVETALNYLYQDVAGLQNPLDWWPQGFQTLYRLAENADFNKATALYRAFIPYSNAKSWLPLEQNIYTYSQIYNSVCRQQMLTARERESLQADLNLWKNSRLSLQNLIRRIEQKNVHSSSKSDLLSTYAGLLVIDNRLSEARDYYWRAHQSCPYNNRAHWGLVLLERKLKYASYPEFASNLQKMQETLTGIEFPQEIASYVMNWGAFPAVSQERIKYGARIWAPFMKELSASDYKVYIKMPFELLSQAPGFGSIRDQRIGPPNMPNYKLDNRLWDDVRGAGGRNVISDHDETFETVQGDYNLLGHEVAHQFHAFLNSKKPALASCIERLYENAKRRNKFPDPYAATNSHEYFAQGVTYFLVPADAPARYGVNVSWYPQNDPDLLQFVQSIQDSNGDFGRIRCPLSL